MPAVAQVMADTTAALTRLGVTVVPADLPFLDQIGDRVRRAAGRVQARHQRVPGRPPGQDAQTRWPV
jgi:hypothetical protein